MFIAEAQDHSIVRVNTNLRRAFLMALFLLAALFRLNNIHASGHLLDREYTSALFARSFYFVDNEQVEPWQREIAITARNQQPILEPPLVEYLVSLIYRLMGREEISYSRYLTTFFWLVGGVFMYMIAKRLLSVEEALIATSYYLFVPMGIIISRSFQPDSLMMMMLLISLYAMVLYFESPSRSHLLLAGILSSITILLRPLVIFAIFCSFLAFSIHRNRNWKKIIDLPLVIFTLVSILPSAAYYGYGILVAGYMRWKVATSFMPYLLIKKDFWLGWLDLVLNVAEFAPLLLAIVGFFLLRNTKVQYWMVGLAVAFVLFSVAFTYHIHTHPYYHIQLLPIVGLCMAPTVVLIVKALIKAAEKYWWIPVMGVFALSIFSAYREFRATLYRDRMEDPKVAWEIGEAVHHSPRTVDISFYYGVPLLYNGQFGGAPWPVKIEDAFYRRPGETERSVQQRLDALGFQPEYFVITNFDLYHRKHQDLQQYLEQECILLAQTDQYMIYSSCMD